MPLKAKTVDAAREEMADIRKSNHIDWLASTGPWPPVLGLRGPIPQASPGVVGCHRSVLEDCRSRS
jgi:hypothetical protein